jgi:hypothetical protein
VTTEVNLENTEYVFVRVLQIEDLENGQKNKQKDVTVSNI